MDAQVWTVPGHAWPTLRPSEVHVWRVCVSRTGSDVAGLEAVLCAEEAARARRFHFKADQQRYIVAHGLLRRLLGTYLNRPAGELRFTTNAHGKPALAEGFGDVPLQFNLSHSGDWVVYAVGQGRAVGIDVEQMRPRFGLSAIAERFFSPREVTVLLGLPQEQQSAAFFRCWARKEAYIKAVGRGLNIPLDQFEVSLAPGEPARLVAAWAEAAASGPWCLREVDVAPDYAAAVMAQGEDWRLACWELLTPATVA